MTGRRTGFMVFFALAFMSFFACTCTTGRFYILLFPPLFPFIFPFSFLYVSILLFSFRFVPLLLLRRGELIHPLCEGETVGENNGQVAGRLTAIWFIISYLKNRGQSASGRKELKRFGFVVERLQLPNDSNYTESCNAYVLNDICVCVSYMYPIMATNCSLSCPIFPSPT